MRSYLLSSILPHLKKNRYKLLAYFLCTALNLSLLAIIPKLHSTVLYMVLDGSLTVSNIIPLFGIIILECIIAYFSKYISANLSVTINSAEKKKHLHYLLAGDPSTLNDGNIDKRVATLYSDTNVISQILFLSTGTIINVCKAAICILMMANYSLTLLSCSMAMFMAPFILTFFYKRILEHKSRNAASSSDSVLGAISNCCNNLRSIIVNGFGPKLELHYSYTIEYSQKAVMEKDKAYLFIASVKSTITSLGNILLLILANYCISSNELSGSHFLAYIIYAQKLSSAFESLSSLPSVAANYKVKSERLYEIYKGYQMSFPTANQSSFDNALAIKQLSLENLCFEFQNKEILRNITLSFDNCQTIISGSNGSGKTTLLRLISGQYRYSSGEIYVNNTKLSELNRIEYSKRLSVYETSVIFNDLSIIDNICLSEYVEGNYSHVIEVCQMLGIYDDIASLPNGFDTIPARDKVLLSKGQIQRISLARCILKPADIYIFDEPTSHTDKDFSYTFLILLEKYLRNKIIIILSHDPTLIESVSTHYMIDHKGVTKVTRG